MKFFVETIKYYINVNCYDDGEKFQDNLIKPFTLEITRGPKK